ncbi:alpha/beta fold hydrolase [Aquibacillus saliphilus]|uniref:alpha/beta fold hydrolase n=1 Tax=Aquibacillus saliphilus TaxID=1909422 RepID=UPI001CF07A38|nr:alpha/beta hydrolase [Aquibacillus saliphilus]
MKERHVQNNGVNIYYLYHGDFNSHHVPIIIIPGLEAAENYIKFMENLYPRPSITISLRGRGKSNTPKEGYTLYDHIQDIETVIANLNINRYIIYGHSYGVSYLMGYALSNSDQIAGIIVGDFPAVHRELPVKWLNQFKRTTVSINRAKQNKSFYNFVSAFQKDSHEVVFWEALKSFHFPVLVVIEDGLTKQDIRKYEWYLPNCQSLIIKDDSNKMLNDKQEFVISVQAFCSNLDSVLDDKEG